MSAIFPSAVATTTQLLIAINNTKVLLDVNAGIGDTTITVDDASPLNSSGYLTFNDDENNPETISYTGKAGNDLTGVTRGADGTSAAVHTADGTVGLEMRWNAAYHNTLSVELIAVEQNISDRFGVGSTAIAVPSGVTFTLAKTSNQIILGTTRTVTITAPTPASSSRTWTIPDITADGTFASLTGTQTFTGAKTFSASVTLAGASSSATIALTSTAVLTIAATTNQFVLGTTNTVTINAAAPAASRVYTIPDAGTTASFVMTQGTQTIVGATTFSAAATFTLAPVLSSTTASTVLTVDGSKNITSSSVTTTQLSGFLNLYKYRRPNLRYSSGSVVSVETGITTGTSGDATVLFPDGDLRTETGSGRYQATTSQNAVFTHATLGNNQGGIRSGSVATNTWYAAYAVKVTTFSANWVMVLDTVLPIQGNYATLNSNFGTNSWVHLGLARYGDNSGATGVILEFRQAGAITIFYNNNTNVIGFGMPGIMLASSAGAVSLTYSGSSGTGATDIPQNIGLEYIVAGCASGGTGGVSLAHGSGNPKYQSTTENASNRTAMNAWWPSNQDVQLIGVNSNAKAIMLAGFVDNALSGGPNPVL